VVENPAFCIPWWRWIKPSTVKTETPKQFLGIAFFRFAYRVGHMNKLTRYQATLQLMNLIKVSKQQAEALLPDLEIMNLTDVENAASIYRK